MHTTATAPVLTPTRTAPVASGAMPHVLVVTSGDAETFRRSLSSLDTLVTVVPSISEAIETLDGATSSIVVDAPLTSPTAEEALEALAGVDAARRRPVFIAVHGDFSDDRALRLYDDGATAVIAWPAEVLVLPRLLSELADVSMADHEDTDVDTALTEAIEARLAVDPDLAGRVHVRVHDGVARLDGTLDSLWKRRRLRDRIAAVPGISALDQGSLTLDVPTVADDVLAATLRTTLAATAGVEETTLSVTTRDGVATVAGVVDSKRHMRGLLRAAETVRGIRRVDNHVTISADAALEGRDHATTLQSLIDPAFPHSDVTIKAFGRVAVLLGSSPTLAERIEVEEAVEDAGFIQRVVNKIDVER